MGAKQATHPYRKFRCHPAKPLKRALRELCRRGVEGISG